MLVTICEQLADVRHDLDATHSRLVVSLNPADAAVRGFGYASVRVAPPGGVARFEGVAVVLPGGFAPDPIQILVTDGPTAGATVARGDLPVLVHVDLLGGSARVVRRCIPPPAALAEVLEQTADDAVEGGPSESASSLPEWEE